MPIERCPARSGEQPVLLDGEEIRFSEPRTRLFSGLHEEGEGVLHLTTKRVVWLGGQGCAIDYPFITLHAVSRDKGAWPDPCLYCQLRTEEIREGIDEEDEEEEPEIPELRFVPADASHLQQMFQVFSEMSAMNPDPNDPQAEDSEEDDDDDDDDDEEDNGKQPVQLGVLWSASANDAAMEDADEEEENAAMDLEAR